MQKYVLTPNNVNDMAGRIKKFFDSCTRTGGMYDYDTKKKNFRSKNTYDFKYESDPSSKSVWVVNDGIHIESPVRTTIYFNSIIYFIGGNKIVVRECNSSNGELSCFKYVYERKLTGNHLNVFINELKKVNIKCVPKEKVPQLNATSFNLPHSHNLGIFIDDNNKSYEDKIKITGSNIIKK